MRVKEESEKAGLKCNTQKTKIIAYGSITSWQIDRENNVKCERLYFGGAPKITADGDCSHEIKTLASQKENYDKPRQHIKNQTSFC